MELASPDDAEEIALLSRDQIEDGLRWRYKPRTVLAMLGDPDVRIAVARREGRIAAFGAMSFGPTEAHLVLLAVRPEHRRRGLAREVVTWLETMAVAAGIELFFVECRAGNHAARGLYASLGYRELAVTRGYYGGVEDAVRLGKDVAG